MVALHLGMLTVQGEPVINDGEVRQKARADDAANRRHKQAPACFLAGKILRMVLKRPAKMPRLRCFIWIGLNNVLFGSDGEIQTNTGRRTQMQQCTRKNIRFGILMLMLVSEYSSNQNKQKRKHNYE